MINFNKCNLINFVSPFQRRYNMGCILWQVVLSEFMLHFLGSGAIWFLLSNATAQSSPISFNGLDFVDSTVQRGPLAWASRTGTCKCMIRGLVSHILQNWSRIISKKFLRSMIHLYGAHLWSCYLLIQYFLIIRWKVHKILKRINQRLR